ncbi:MAG: GGDEF domain-containing protein [Pseudomonadota bacterium]
MKLRTLSLEQLPPILLSFAGILGIGPMAVFRLLEGNLLVAAIDGAAACAFGLVAWFVYVKGAVRGPSICMAVIAFATVVSAVSIRGPEHLIWMYPSIVAMFYLLNPKEAAVSALAAIAAVFPVMAQTQHSGGVAIYLASFAVTIALSVAFAALAAGQRRALYRITLKDPLTGVGNRRALDLALDAAIGSSKRKGSFVLIMMDIDHFKSVNDLHGHSTGDEVLRRVAHTIGSKIRPTDECFRAGGEEFVILAKTADIEQAQALAERLRVAVAGIEHTHGETQETMTVTASFGLAEHRAGESRDSLYRRADDALYEAKRSGRNRLHLSEGTASLSGTANYAVIPDLEDDASFSEAS